LEYKQPLKILKIPWQLAKKIKELIFQKFLEIFNSNENSIIIINNIRYLLLKLLNNILPKLQNII
jgi:hypothetical protein